MIRIVDNKKLELTDSEWEMYQNICSSYDKPHRKGVDLFRDLFEVDGDGIIIMVKPPTQNHTSMEIWLFIISVMTNQHLRAMHNQVNMLCREAKDSISLLQERVEKYLEK